MRFTHVASIFLCCIIALACSSSAETVTIADFESGSYDNWKTTGNAFGSQPAEGTLAGQLPVSGFEGSYLVNTFLNGDQDTGTLISPEFTLHYRYLNFLIGGGYHLEQAIHWCRKAYELEPANSKYAYTFAYYNVQKDRAEKAIKVLQPLVDSRTDNPQIYIMLA